MFAKKIKARLLKDIRYWAREEILAAAVVAGSSSDVERRWNEDDHKACLHFLTLAQQELDTIDSMPLIKRMFTE